MERMAGLGAGNPQGRVRSDQLVAGVDDFDGRDRGFQPVEAARSPPAKLDAVAQLGDGLERDHLVAADEDRFVASGEQRVGDQTATEHVSVNDHRSTHHSVASVQNSFEESVSFLVGEMVDHVLTVGRVRLGASEYLVNGEFE